FISLGKTFLSILAVTEAKEWNQKGLWYRPPLSNPAGDSTIAERLFKGFHCAEILKHGSTVDPVRL
ncbi:hypothetical protein K469DRAFT_574227, partial [Zopfia rhizophila CBS 207.26]